MVKESSNLLPILSAIVIPSVLFIILSVLFVILSVLFVILSVLFVILSVLFVILSVLFVILSVLFVILSVLFVILSGVEGSRRRLVSIFWHVDVKRVPLGPTNDPAQGGK